MTFISVLPIIQSYKIKLEGKFELGTQVNQIVKDITKKITERGGPLELLSIGNTGQHTLLEHSNTEENLDAGRMHPDDEPLLKEFLNANGEKFHLYGVHQSGGNTNDDIGKSNIVVRKKRRRRNGFILII